MFFRVSPSLDVHYLVTEAEEIDGQGSWGEETGFDVYIEHPLSCERVYLTTWKHVDHDGDCKFFCPVVEVPLDEPQVISGDCALEDYLCEAEPEAWPTPPFRVPVRLRTEMYQTYDSTEYESWLEPISETRQESRDVLLL